MKTRITSAIKNIVSIFGYKIYRKGLAWYQIEPEELERFLNFYKVDCIFDVGANTGQYASMLRNIGYGGLIISFEPNPADADILRVSSKNDDKWHVIESALDEEVKTVAFNITKNSQCSSLHQPNLDHAVKLKADIEVEKTLKIETRTLSELFPDLKLKYGFSRPYLKMDTQGNDLYVAKGAKDFLKCFVGLQSELALTTLYKNQPRIYDALEYYKSEGFKLSALVPNNAGHFPDLYEVDCIMYNGNFKE